MPEVASSPGAPPLILNIPPLAPPY
jgi:hypothetical protein